MLRRRHEAIAPRLRSKTTGKEESRKRRRIKISRPPVFVPALCPALALCGAQVQRITSAGIRSGCLSAVALCGSPVWRSVSAGIRSGSLSAVALCGSQLWRSVSAGILSGSPSAVALCRLSGAADHVRRHPFRLSVGCRPVRLSSVAECVRRHPFRLSVRCRPVRLSSVAEYVRRYSLRLSVSCRPLWALSCGGSCPPASVPAVCRLSPSVGSPSALILCPSVRLYSVPERVGWYFVRLSFRGRPVRLSVGLSFRLRGVRVGFRPTYQTGRFVGELATGGTG